MSNSEVKVFVGLQSFVSWSLDDRSQLAGVDTRGCDCYHHGMSPAWHTENCAWITNFCSDGENNA